MENRNVIPKKEKSIIGNGRKHTESILPTENRLDLSKIDHKVIDGKTYVSFDHYLKCYEAAHVAENQVEGLETMVQLGIPFDERNFDNRGYYPAFWLNNNEQPIGLKPLLKNMQECYQDH